MKYLYVFFTMLLTISAIGLNNPTSVVRVPANVVPEPKIKVLIIDTGVEPHVKIKPFLAKDYEKDKINYPTDYELKYPFNSNVFHGTHIAGIVLFGNQAKTSEAVCSNVEIYSCVFYDPNFTPQARLQNTVTCFQKALELGVDFVNYSAGGLEPDEDEKKIIKKLSQKNVKIIVAAGNERKSYKDQPYFPAMYSNDPEIDNVIPVANLNEDGIKAETTSWSPGMMFDSGTNIHSTIGMKNYGLMTGSSQAAAMYTHRLLLRQCAKIKLKKP